MPQRHVASESPGSDDQEVGRRQQKARLQPTELLALGHAVAIAVEIQVPVSVS